MENNKDKADDLDIEVEGFEQRDVHEPPGLLYPEQANPTNSDNGRGANAKRSDLNSRIRSTSSNSSLSSTTSSSQSTTKQRSMIDDLELEVANRDLASWVPSESQTGCFSCEVSFGWMLRPHHCRNCGRVFCHACSNYFVVLPKADGRKKYPQAPNTRYYRYTGYIKSLGGENVRVCKDCHRRLEVERETQKLVDVFSSCGILTLEELRTIGLVSSSWRRATLVLRSRFRHTQYALPTEQLKPGDFELLWANRNILAGHSGYLVKILRGLDWSKADRVKEVKDLLSRKKEKMCFDTMCSRYCTPKFALSHALELLCTGIDSDDLLGLVIETLRTSTDEEVMCVLPVLVHSLQSAMLRRRSPGLFTSPLLDYLLDISARSRDLSTELFWLIQTNFERSSAMYTFLKQNLMKRIGPFRAQMLERGDAFVEALESTVSEITSVDKIKIQLMEKMEVMKPFQSGANSKHPLEVPLNVAIKAVSIDYDKISIKDSANKPRAIQTSSYPIPLAYVVLSVLITLNLAEDYKGRRQSKVLFKREDLRKDQIVVNLIRLMDFTLKEEQMDLGIITYRVLPTSTESGMIDIVMDSQTVHKIQQTPHRSIQNWILFHNKKKTVDEVKKRFIRSLAAYCAITYLLGIGDRHLENIMVTEAGELFHIDFGFVLGQDPKVMAPQIRLNAGMLDAIGGVGSEYYQEFDSLVKKAFLCLRRRVSLFTALLLLLADAHQPIDQGKNKFSREQLIEQINTRFMVGQTEEEAVRAFDSFMLNSENSWGALIIDVTHNNRDKSLASVSSNVVEAVKGLKKGWFG